MTVDQAVRMTFPGSSAQSNEQSHALNAELEIATERLQQAVDAQRLIDILADAESQMASDAGAVGLGNQDSVQARTTAPTSVSEEVFPGVDPQENEELLKSEAEFIETFGSQLPSLEAAVNITQGYDLSFKACAESNGFQIARERQAIRDMLQRSVVDWMIGKGLLPRLLPRTSACAPTSQD